MGADRKPAVRKKAGKRKMSKKKKDEALKEREKLLSEKPILDFKGAIDNSGLTVNELAKRMGTSPAMISTIRNGKANMTWVNIKKLAKILKVSVRSVIVE